MGLTADISGGPIKHKAGSPGYWAPEQVKGEPYTTAPDWWSLGVTIYALATDKKLFHSEEETCNKMVKDHDWTKSPCITSDALKDCLQQLCADAVITHWVVCSQFTHGLQAARSEHCTLVELYDV